MKKIIDSFNYFFDSPNTDCLFWFFIFITLMFLFYCLECFTLGILCVLQFLCVGFLSYIDGRKLNIFLMIPVIFIQIFLLYHIIHLTS